jgi:hypothetical protein
MAVKKKTATKTGSTKKTGGAKKTATSTTKPAPAPGEAQVIPGGGQLPSAQ